MRTRIKICGITRVEDGLAAVEAGADAIGLVFFEKSPRNVTPEQAAEIVSHLGPFVSVTALFVNESPDIVQAVMREVPIDLLQFHGDETPDYCTGFGRRYIKAIRMSDNVSLERAMQECRHASGILLDSFDANAYGGTGQRFDWQRIPVELRERIVLAGGLNPENVGEAVSSIRPYAVDVSSGVESAPGIKDQRKIQRFVASVREQEK